MSTLVAWDYGGGLGHITALAGVLARLEGPLSAVVRNPEAARAWFPERTRCSRAPALHPTPNPVLPLSYADVLAGLGWRNPRKIRADVEAWRPHLERAERVLVDTSPALLLALRETPRPTLGFCNPWGLAPDRTPLPSIRPWEPVSDDALWARERPILASIQSATGVELSGLSALYELPHALYGIRETDPWHAHRQDRTYVGPVVHTAGGLRMDFPEGAGARVFAYLRGDYRGLPDTLDALVRLDVPVLAFVPGHRSVQRGQVRITSEPANFDHLAPHADLIVTHSVLGTGFSFLQHGVPVLLLPMQGEQLAMAHRCQAMDGIEQLRVPEILWIEDRLHRMLEPGYRTRTRSTRAALALPQDPFGTVARMLEALS